jgi:hypothetical protein
VSRREAVLSALGVFVVALVVRVVLASRIDFPAPEDTAYYTGVARNMVTGRGLVTDAIWSYGTPPLVFPRPAFEVWLPLPSFLAALTMTLIGATFSAAQLPFVVIGATVPVLAWRLAADVAAERGFDPTRARLFAIGAGLTAAIYLPLLLHSALPDSTMPFAALALSACLLMARIARAPGGGRITDPRLLGLGALIGLAALTRNEALWIGATWAIVAWRIPALDRAVRLRLIVTAGVIAAAVFAPWAIRDWIVFGSPLPGQAATNALSITGFDIFAWNDPPTLSRYLAVGLPELLRMRVDGLAHNLFSVLLLPGLPLSVVGLLAIPWHARDAAIRPVLIVSLITFLFTSLVFPVATTWGTFLHAAGPVHVLVIVAALSAFDAALVRVAARRAWTKPMTWVGPALGIAGSALFSILILPSYGANGRATEATFEAIGARMAAVGHPLDDAAGPIITNFPIWMAETLGVRALALPDETPADVLDLARDPRFGGAHLLIIDGTEHGAWPAVLDGDDPDAACFREIDIANPGSSEDILAETRAFEIVCP